MTTDEVRNNSNELSNGEKNTTTPLLLGSGMAVLLAAAAFFSGLHIGSLTDQNNSQTASLLSSLFRTNVAVSEEKSNLDEFWNVWGLLDDKFALSSSTEQISDEEKIEGAIKGLVKSYGDPYTVYFPAADANMFEQDISGNFGGVGMEVGLRDGLLTVVAPLPDTPAERAGIMTGDKIVKIDGQSTESMSVDEGVRLIRGEVGTTVEMSLYREGESDFIDVSVVRDNISIPTVDTKEENGVFIISLYSFNAVAEAKMQDALREYIKSGDKKLVLDLRGNPGGFLQSAVSIASYFLPSGKVVVREGQGNDDDKLYRSNNNSLGARQPEEMVILVNAGSASASEILAGALSEHGVATLMGNTTFGKGSVQELVDLPSGASLKVTIARWFTPEGKSISNGGLDPDVFVDRTAEDYNAGKDPQLEAAISWLNGDKTVGTTTKKTAINITQ